MLLASGLRVKNSSTKAKSAAVFAVKSAASPAASTVPGLFAKLAKFAWLYKLIVSVSILRVLPIQKRGIPSLCQHT